MAPHFSPSQGPNKPPLSPSPPCGTPQWRSHPSIDPLGSVDSLLPTLTESPRRGRRPTANQRRRTLRSPLDTSTPCTPFSVFEFNSQTSVTISVAPSYILSTLTLNLGSDLGLSLASHSQLLSLSCRVSLLDSRALPLVQSSPSQPLSSLRISVYLVLWYSSLVLSHLFASRSRSTLPTSLYEIEHHFFVLS